MGKMCKTRLFKMVVLKRLSVSESPRWLVKTQNCWAPFLEFLGEYEWDGA